MSDWQPIETAPKDGTRILVLIGSKVQIAQWNEDGYVKKPTPFWHWAPGLGKGFNRGQQPAHWMHLPEPLK